MASAPAGRLGPSLRGLTVGGEAARLLGIVAIAAPCAVSVIWALTVPMFQSPDEDLHYDYVLALVHRGGLLTVRDQAVDLDPLLHRITDPQVQYLIHSAGFDSIVFRPRVRAPQNYGSDGYYSAVDSGAPAPRSARTSPYLLPYYPFLYYAADALVVGLLGHVRSTPTAMFFVARLFSTALLASSLFCFQHLCRLRGMGTIQAGVATLALGLLPLTSFMSSYVQPDNLALFLVSAGLLLLQRWLSARTDLFLVTAGGAIAMLLLTKYQVFLSLGTAGALMVLSASLRSSGWRLALRNGTLLAAPTLVTSAANLWVLAGWRAALVASNASDLHWNYSALLTSFHEGPKVLLRQVIIQLRSAAVDYYLGGTTFRSYWGLFGWVDTPIVIVNHTITETVLRALEVATLGVIALASLYVIRGVLSAIRDFRGGRRVDILWRALADPVLVTYVVFATFMFLLYVVIGDTFNAQGRNWFALLPATVLLTISVAPRALAPSPLQAWVGTVLLAGLTTYAIGGSVFAFQSMHDRYYGVGREVRTAAIEGLPVSLGEGDYQVSRMLLPFPVDRIGATSVPRGGTIAVGGWAFDRQMNAPARAVFITVDDRSTLQAFYGDPTRDMTGGAAPVSYNQAGFDAIVPTDGLAAGHHYLRILVLASDGSRVYESEQQFGFDVQVP